LPICSIFKLYLYLETNNGNLFPIMDKLIELGKKIKERREQLSFTQADLAEITGISQRTIRSLEKGKGSISLSNLIKITEPLGLEILVKFKPMSDEARKGFIQ
jgi:y4mF family transcriptional regulator